MRLYRVLFAGLVGLVLVGSNVSATSSAAAGSPAAVFGWGQVHATDDFGGYFPNAALFGLHAGGTASGGAWGGFDLVAYGDFASAWGACPFDPRCRDFPNRSTKWFTLNGRVSGVVSVNDTVTITGSLTETDYDRRNRVIFDVANDPFQIVAEAGSRSFVLKFCEVPPFTMDVGWGFWLVHPASGSLQASLLKRPTSSPALPCRQG